MKQGHEENEYHREQDTQTPEGSLSAARDGIKRGA